MRLRRRRRSVPEFRWHPSLRTTQGPIPRRREMPHRSIRNGTADFTGVGGRLTGRRPWAHRALSQMTAQHSTAAGSSDPRKPSRLFLRSVPTPFRSSFFFPFSSSASSPGTRHAATQTLTAAVHLSAVREHGLRQGPA